MSTKTATSVLDAPATEASSGDATIVVTSPVTGEEIGRVPLLDPNAVQEAVSRARSAQREWSQRSLSQRAEALRTFRRHLIRRAEELIDLLMRENGKTREEAIFAEIVPSILKLTYAAAKGPRFLRPQRIRSWGPSLTKKTTLYYLPRGVVGIIAPWNYPFGIPMTDLGPALLAGNAVVLKPSEWTPLIALKLKEIFDESGMNPDLLQVVTGDGATGAALIDAGVDKVCFTGSIRVGKIIGSACGAKLIPCTLELGGKAPALVLDDADLERTARAILWGRFANSGQTCIAVDRVLVPEEMHDRLLARVADLASNLRQGNPLEGEVDVGAMPFPGQLKHIESLIEDALSRGARLVMGGERLDRPGRYFRPTILTDVTTDMRVATEECFGPLLPFIRYRTVDEAVQIANSLPVGLNAYVFSSNRARALEVARRIEAGSVIINDVLLNYGMPEVPFGGVKESGLGRVHGPEGIRAMCQRRVVVEERLPISPKRELWWHPYSRAVGDKMLAALDKIASTLDKVGRI